MRWLLGDGHRARLSSPSPLHASLADQRDDTGAQKQQCAGFRNGRRSLGRTVWSRYGQSGAAAAQAVGASRKARAAAANAVGIQRYCASLRQGPTAVNCCAGVQGDAGEREDISFERSSCTEGRGAADRPIQGVI